MFGNKALIETAPYVPAPDERLAMASAVSGYARNQFLAAAFDLENAADQLDTLAFDVQGELDALTDVLTAAINDADANRRSARSIRNLVEGEPVLTLF